MKKPLLFAALSRRVAGITEQAQLYFDTIRRTPVVITPAGESLPLENRSAKGSAGGYASLDGSGYVPTAQLGSGATGAGTRFLADDYTWKAGGGGGGTLDHAALTSNLAWTTSGHTGTADRLAGFSGAGAAVAASVSAPLAYSSSVLSLSGWSGSTDGDMLYRNGSAVGTKTPAQARTWLDLATYYQPLDAGLTSLTAADASAGLPYVSAANTWATATYSGMLSVVGGAWKVVGLRESGGTDLTMGAVADGEVLRRSGTTVAGSSADTVVSDAAGANGLVTRTASGAVTARSIEVGAGLSVSNGDGVSGNPSISLEDMIKSVRAFNYFSIILPQGPTTPNLDGTGVLSSAGISNTAFSESNFPAFQIGDVSTVLCRWYILAYYRIEAGTYVIYFWFRLKADITTGTQTIFMGLTSAVGLSSADPSGHRACIRYVSGTDTTWQLSTKDGTTQALTDTTVAVTASYYYAVKMTVTSSSAAVVIGRAATAAGAITDLASAGSTSSSSNMPATGTDLYLIQSINRSGATTTARGIVSGGAWLSLTP